MNPTPTASSAGVFQAFEFDDIIRIGIAAVIIFATILSVSFVIWGGFLMIISGGKEEKIKPAVNHIRHAIIGVIFLLVVLFVFPILMNLIGLPYGDYAKPSSIFDTMNEISAKIFGSELDAPWFDVTPTDSALPPDFIDL